MNSPPGSARIPQTAQASAGRQGPSREMRRRAIHAIGVMNRVPFAQARQIYADTVLPVLHDMPQAEVDAYLRATFRVDPTGTTAVRNVTRERGF